MKKNRINYRIDTTLGELIATVSEVAYEHARDSKDAYHLARLVLVGILKKATRRSKGFDGHISRAKHLH